MVGGGEVWTKVDYCSALVIEKPSYNDCTIYLSKT